MVEHRDTLRQKARELALRHTPKRTARSRTSLLKRAAADLDSLRAFANLLQHHPASCTQPAEDWLLDNIEFIGDQVKGMQQQITGALPNNLPYLRKERQYRIQSICIEYIALVDGVLDETSLVEFVNAYQEVSVLTVAEAWSIPLFLRLALIHQLTDVMLQVQDRREICMDVERLLGQFEPGAWNAESLGAKLEEEGQSFPLSGAWAVHLISHLREWADHAASVREWLICQFENGDRDLDRIVTYELQLQASYQRKAGHLISSLRKNERWSWDDAFVRISLVEQTLRQDRTDTYPKLDAASRGTIRHRVELLARRLRVQENLVAREALALAEQASALPAGVAMESASAVKEGSAQAAGQLDTLGASIASTANLMPRRSFLAYYLFEPRGVSELQRSLKKCSKPRPLPGNRLLGRRAQTSYMALLACLFAVFWAALSLIIGWGQGINPVGWFIVMAAVALPASEWAVTGLHYIIECAIRPNTLLRYDFSAGVPAEAATMVVIPVIWSSKEEVDEMVDRLEIHYLANRSPHIHYAILGDFTDSRLERLPEDDKLAAYAIERVERLSKRYSISDDTTFHLYQRSRWWNPGEEVYMGWERKRGKLVEFVELLKGSNETSYDYTYGNAAVLPRIRYIITLDADTRLPLESAHRMIGALHLPYNRPRLNEKRSRVVEGYGVLQPRIGIHLESALQSRLAGLWSVPGLDPYSFAASDPYQDALGEGIFTGKGIFDVDAFAETLCERIPENRVLSHDLLEGGFLRAGLLTDVELIDDHPAKFIAYQKRLHRWVRGDWQLLGWLFPRMKSRRGELLPVDLSIITRWQIIDNLRRSLLPIVLFALLLGFTILPGTPWRWLGVVLATMFIPVIRQLVNLTRAEWDPRGIGMAAAHAGLALLALPFQAVLMVDAIARTLYRLSISKRRLLEWTSSLHIERSNRENAHPPLLGMTAGYVLVLLAAAASILQRDPYIASFGVVLCLLWAMAPAVIRWLDQAEPEKAESVSVHDERELRELARQIWAFYEDYTVAEDHWLPPDNVQIDPPNGVAHRTSPTNIGFFLTAALTARDFGFINTAELLERLERTIHSVERMEKWNGHLFNWYDTLTLKPLVPVYVSTVDSGNFVASLIAVKQGVAEWLMKEFPGKAHSERNRLDSDGRDDLHFEFAAELEKLKQESSHGPDQVLERGRELLERVETLINGTDFRALYDHKAKLFVLGYHAASGERDAVLYDLLASEARQTSFVAIALGQISVSHWMALGRATRSQGGRTALVSWSGTMFEYLMPWLLMRTYPKTIWDSTYRGVVRQQMAYAKERGVPFGISESGYYAFDYQKNYQYRAFGVPGLGFKRGLEQDLVLAPYAAIMALPYAVAEGMDNLRRMEEMGARGKYGFYEAIDCTPERMPDGSKAEVIRSFMAHHQGMSLLTIANMLHDHNMIERFHRDKRIQTAELLLQERIPAKPAQARVEAAGSQRIAQPTQPQASPVRSYPSADTPAPEAAILSNGSFTTVITNSGSGQLRSQGLAVSRWREDPVKDDWGSYMYIRDVQRDECWSPTYQPCRVPPSSAEAHFSLEKALFKRTDGEMQTALEIAVSPDADAEVRKLTLYHAGADTRTFEVTTFLELALARPDADAAHPAFTKLFIETEYDAKARCLLARKRPRNADEQALWAFHVFTDGEEASDTPEMETDRARFIGRGHTLAAPKGLRSRLGGAVGSVADPAFIMRRRITLQAGERIALYAVTGVAGTREEALALARTLSRKAEADRVFEHAWTHAQIELHNMQLSPADAAVYHVLASRALYSGRLNDEQEASIAVNTKAQSGLWSYGVSGDRPIVLVTIDDAIHLPFIHKLLSGHEYLLRKGLSLDVVVLNGALEGYQQNVQENLQRSIEHRLNRYRTDHGSAYLIASAGLPDEDRALLFATARVVLRADGPSLKAQLKAAEASDSAAGQEDEEQAEANRKPSSQAKANLPQTKQQRLKAGHTQSDSYQSTANAGESEMSDSTPLLFFNGWGGFSRDGSEYRMTLKDDRFLPAPWINVMANPRFGCLVSELNTGYTWWRNSRECKLTPWSNDPALDPRGEACYLKDDKSGEYWLVGSPNREEGMDGGARYNIAHGMGYSRYAHDSGGLHQELTVFVPVDAPIKIMKLRLRNPSDERRELSVTYYAEWVLGVNRQSNASHIVSEWNGSVQALIARNTYQDTFRDATAFLAVYPAASAENEPSAAADASMRETSWTVDRQEFIGRNRTAEQPAALERDRLSDSDGPVSDSCGAVQTRFAIEPGGERTIYMLLGCDDSVQAAEKWLRKYREPAACEQAYEEIRQFWSGLLGTVAVSTPSKEMDMLLNNWLLYQSLACRMWARSAFYQAGGAYGFRDQLQDSLSMLHCRPDLTRAQIIIHASHQYKEGDVQHWWHEETHRGIRTRFSDDLLWLPYALSRYLEHTGDDSLLEESAPYLQSELLREGEHERYEETVLSGDTGTVYEHCLRVLDHSLERFGEHGLPLIGIGDWNDGMSLVGAEGRGESVWLGWFMGDVLIRFAAVCERRGDTERAGRYRDVAGQLKLALNEHGWDGQWYRRAFTDAGQWLGSVHQAECRIDSIAQSWSVISGLAEAGKAARAMNSFDRELVDRDMEMAYILTPPFNNTEPSPGYIQGYPPGIRENGGQYTHGVIWSIVAWSMLGNGDKAFELFHMLNPITHTMNPAEVNRYYGEPYVMAADVYSAEPHKGHAGWTWYTGAAGWMYQAGLEWILGIRRRGDKLIISPCIPKDWPAFSVRYRHGNAEYRIQVSNPAGKCSPSRPNEGQSKLAIDGKELDLEKYFGEEGPFIPLRDEQGAHEVELTL